MHRPALTDEDVRHLKADAQDTPIEELASLYGVSVRTIARYLEDPSKLHPCRVRYSDEVKRQAIEAVKQGASVRRTARNFGCGCDTLRKWIRQDENRKGDR